MAEITDVKGVSDSRADDLQEEGFTTIDDVATASPDALAEVSGIGMSTAEGLIESAQDVIREDTLGEEDEDSEEEEQTQAADDEGTDEPSEEELRELVEEQPEGEISADDVDAEDDEEGSELVEVEPEEPYDVEIALETGSQYDFFYSVMLDVATNRLYVSGPQEELANYVLDSLRGLSGSGVVELELDTSELNALHAAVVKAKTSHQGGGSRAHSTLKEVEGQVKSAREEYVL